MCDVNTAVRSIMTSMSLDVVKNINVIQETSFVAVTNVTEMQFENNVQQLDTLTTEFLPSKDDDQWKTNSVQTLIVEWSLLFIRYMAIPSLLFYLTTLLWELRYVRMRDSTTPLPLPPGSMGLPILGEMLQFFITVSEFYEILCVIINFCFANTRSKPCPGHSILKLLYIHCMVKSVRIFTFPIDPLKLLQWFYQGL